MFMVAPESFLGVTSLGAEGVWGIWSGAGAAADFFDDFFSFPKEEEEDFFPLLGAAVPGFHMVLLFPKCV